MNYDPNLAASVTNTAQKMMIPLLRTALPNLMAQQIVGVQPMATATGSIFKRYWPKRYNKKYWPYQYDVAREDRWDIERWCWDNFKGRYWHSHGSQFVFKSEKDAVMFAMRWL